MLFIYIISSMVISFFILFIKNKNLTKLLSLIFLTMVISINMYSFINLNKVDSLYYKFDSIGVLLSLILMILSITTFYHSFLYFKRNKVDIKYESVYYSSLIMLIVTMNSVYFAENIAILWVSVEATTLLVSILIFHERTKESLEATWKYLFVSSFGVALVFMGILFLSMTAGNNGLTNLSLANLISIAHLMNPLWLKIAFLLILTGFSAKMELFPLHTVAVDAHTVAPTPINVLLSTTLANVGFLGIFRIYTIISNTKILIWAQHLLIIAGVLSVFMASIQLLRVKHYKRMFAFSSLEHMGLVAIGLGVGGIGYYAAILHLVFHSFVKASLFYQIGEAYQIFNSYLKDNMKGYFKINQVGALAFILGIISILALPPSGIFISEFLLFKAMFLNGHIYIAILVMFLLTVIIYIFSRNFFHFLYSDTSSHINLDDVKINNFESIFQFLLLGLVIYLGFAPPVFFTNLIDNSISILIH